MIRPAGRRLSVHRHRDWRIYGGCDFTKLPINRTAVDDSAGGVSSCLQCRGDSMLTTQKPDMEAGRSPPKPRHDWTNPTRLSNQINYDTLSSPDHANVTSPRLTTARRLITAVYDYLIQWYRSWVMCVKCYGRFSVIYNPLSEPGSYVNDRQPLAAWGSLAWLVGQMAVKILRLHNVSITVVNRSPRASSKY